MKKLRKIVFSAFLFLSFTIFAQEEGAAYYPALKNPSEIVVLRTAFDVYFDVLFNTIAGHKNLQPSCRLSVPSNWNKAYSEFKGTKTVYGCATYRLVLKGLKPDCRYAFYIKSTPASSCAVYVDGNLIASSGTVAAYAGRFRPAYEPVYADFTSSHTGEAELVVQVANFVYRKGGLWLPVYFGEQDALYRYYNTEAGIIAFVCSMLLFLCIVCFTIFALNIKKRSSLYLGLFLLSLLLRMGITGFNILPLLFKNFPYSVLFKMEYSVLWIGPPAFLFFLYSMFKWMTKYRRLTYAYGILEAVLGLLTVCLPISIVNKLVPVFEIVTIIGSVFCIVVLIAGFFKREKHIAMYSLSVLVVALALLHEIMYLAVHGAIIYSYIPLAVLILAVIQFFTLAAQESELFSDRVVLIHKLKRLNDSYIRFVPREFLDMLNKRDITDVALGDYVQKDMGILFAQIYVSADSEDITLEEQYDIFSTFSMVVSLLMPQYRGFVSKFLSRGLIALFPDGAQNAIDCCFEIQDRIDKLNEIRRAAGRPLVFVAMGIHYGRMILGTIGENSRLDDTVISDAVNTAARIESVSETLHYPVLASLEAIEKSNLAENADIALVPLGNIHVKGRIKLVLLFNCMQLEQFRKKLAKTSGTSHEKKGHVIHEIA